MSNLTSKKSKDSPNEAFDNIIKNDKKLASFLNEGKTAIDAFQTKKSKRFETLIRKKRENKLKRMKEDYEREVRITQEDFDIQEKRGKEDILLEGEFKKAIFQEEIEEKALNKKIKINSIDELNNERILSLNEELDKDDNVKTNIKENCGKKGRRDN